MKKTFCLLFIFVVAFSGLLYIPGSLAAETSTYQSGVTEIHSENNFYRNCTGPHRDDLGDILARFDLPYTMNAGLAWDGEYIWGVTRNNNRRLFCIDPENFDVIEDYAIDQTDVIGMTYDPVDGVFWVCEHAADQNSLAYLYDREGDQVGSIELPRPGHHGLAWDGRFFYANSENAQNDQRMYRLTREGEVVGDAPSVAAVLNHGRAVSIEWVGQHDEGHFWVMSVGFITQLDIDFDNDRIEVIQEFQSQQADYPHQGLAHDGFNLWAGGSWREALGFIYDDGIEETYGVLGLDREMIEFGPVSAGNDVELILQISNDAEEGELNVLEFMLTDFGEEPNWLEISEQEGVIEAQAMLEVTFTAHTEGLELGEYDRIVRLDTNDPDRLEVDIPVHMFVVEGMGRLHGVVLEAAEQEPIPNAVVTVDYFGYTQTTDENGAYDFADIPAWTYDLVVTHDDFLAHWEREVEIPPGEEVELDFEMYYARCIPDPERIEHRMPLGETVEIPLSIGNPGTGTLTWTVELEFPEEMQVEPWEHRWHNPTSDLVENTRLGGVAWADGNFYVAGGVRDDANQIYIINREGEFTGQFDQWGDSNYGMRDMTFDGSLLWGIDGGQVFGFTTAGDLEIELESPIDPARCIAWEPDRELLWLCNITSDLVAIDLNNEVIVELDRPGIGLHIYGMDWYPEDPDGYHLYTFCADGEFDRQIHKIDVNTGETQLVLEASIEGQAGAAQVSGTWDPYSWVFIGLTRSDPDAIEVLHIGSRTDWISVEPEAGAVESGSSTELAVTLNSTGLVPEVDYSANLVFSHDGVGHRTTVPVVLSVTGEGGVSQRTIHFDMGWNMVSTNVIPENDSIEVILAPLVADDLLLQFKDSFGRFYNPDWDFNNIPGWNVAEGYQAKVLRDCDLLVSGEAVAWNTPIELIEGWQIVAYYPRDAVDAMLGFSGISDYLVLAKDAWGNFYKPEWEFSNMGDLREGQGYQVKITEPVDLVYVLEEGEVAWAPGLSASDRSWLRELQPTGRSYSLLLLAGGVLPVGTRLEAFAPAGILAGRGVTGVDGRAGMALWGDDPSTDAIDGFQSGEGVSIQQLSGSGASVQLDLTWQDFSSQQWELDGWGAVRVEGSSLPLAFALEAVYPNPFNSRLNLVYTLGRSGNAEVAVFDLAGRRVLQLTPGVQPAGRHTLSLDGEALGSGLYIVRLASGGKEAAAKVLLIR